MKLIISEEKTNLGRQREFDYAKVIAIVFMVLIHVWEELSYFDCSGVAPTGFWHNLLQFGAGPLAAPLFMFAMGVGICYSSHRSPKDFAKRGVQLFITGYLLNIFRNGIYYAIYYWTHGEWDIRELIYQSFNGDILHFAGLTFLLVALLKKCKMPVLTMGGVAVVMQIVGYLLSQYVPVSEGLSYVVGCFYYAGNCDFPLLQWFVFPVAGIVFAKYLRHITDKDKFYRLVIGVSAMLLIGFCSALYFAGYNIQNFYILKDDIYYQQEFFHSIFAILVILIELALLYFATKKVSIKAINSTVNYISARLNTIYIIQWILVGTATFVAMMAGIDELSAAAAISLGIAFVILSVLISRLYDSIKLKKRYSNMFCCKSFGEEDAD